MLIKIPKYLLHALPITASQTHIDSVDYELKGYGDVESVRVYMGSSLTTFDLRTMFAILFMFQNNDQVIFRKWSRNEGQEPIEVAITKTHWYTFLHLRGNSNNKRPSESYTSLIRLATVLLDYRFNDQTKNYILRFIQDVSMIDNQSKKIEYPTPDSVPSRSLNLGLIISRKLFDDSMKGITINVFNLRSHLSPLATIFGTWVQGHKYTSASESVILNNVFHIKKFKGFNRNFAASLDKLIEIGILKSWSKYKEILTGVSYEWELVNAKERLKKPIKGADAYKEL